MKKLHKINGIDLKTCSAEQKIAYNLAFSYGEYYKDADRLMELYRLGYVYKQDRYNEEAIKTALHNGLEKYLEKPFIASSYEIIGKTFTLSESC